MDEYEVHPFEAGWIITKKDGVVLAVLFRTQREAEIMRDELNSLLERLYHGT